MVKGNFACVGSPQHLKAKYGKGYYVKINILTSLQNESENTYQGAVLQIQKDFLWNLPQSTVTDTFRVSVETDE